MLSRLAPEPMKVVLNWGRRYSLWVFNFGLACCAIEFIAASMARHDFIRLGVIPFAPGPRQADLMIVSGTVTDKMAPAVKRLYEQMPEPKYVISFGACSNCGGPYWDSYSVTKGVDQIIPVDVYVPGCPPRPEALLQGILKLQEKIARESLGERYAERGHPGPADQRPRRRPADPGGGPGVSAYDRLPDGRHRDLRRGGHGRGGVRPAHRRRARRLLDRRPRNRPRQAGLHLLRLAERRRRTGHGLPGLRPRRRPRSGRQVAPPAAAHDRPARRRRCCPPPSTSTRARRWHERETHEMFGVDFTDHPHLVPLLLPENFEGHPLRKDFVLAARVAKAWPGAKEPGESEHGGPKRRQMLPPGVPDPNEWGPLKGQLPPAPARPARSRARGRAGRGPNARRARRGTARSGAPAACRRARPRSAAPAVRRRCDSRRRGGWRRPRRYGRPT